MERRKLGVAGYVRSNEAGPTQDARPLDPDHGRLNRNKLGHPERGTAGFLTLARSHRKPRGRVAGVQTCSDLFRLVQTCSDFVQICSDFVQTAFHKEKQGLSGFVFRSVQKCSEVFRSVQTAGQTKNRPKLGTMQGALCDTKRPPVCWDWMRVRRVQGGAVGGISVCKNLPYFTSCLLKPSHPPFFLGFLGGGVSEAGKGRLTEQIPAPPRSTKPGPHKQPPTTLRNRAFDL